MTWLPEWRVTVGDDVYTNVTSVSYATGRLDIDRQCTAGYCRVELINDNNAPFTINVTEPITLELKNTSGTYITVFGGEVSDFNIGVRSPEESGFITTGTVLGIGSLARLTKAIFNTALAEGLDGAQIAAILGAALNLSWAEVTPTVTWATYPATVTWEEAESYLGTVDSGNYTMISLAASATEKSQSLVDQIANSALGQIFETKDGLVSYDDADSRSDYLATYGYTLLDASYATPSSIKSTTQTARIRNSLIYKYGAGYASTYSTSNTDSIASYGLFERSQDSNIKNLADITSIGTRDLTLRKTPRGSLEAITFRLDNPDMSNALRNDLIAVFFGQPVSVTNLPTNLLGGSFDGFVENVVMKATPTYVDLTLYISAADFSLPLNYGNYTLAQTLTADGTFTVPSGTNQIAVLIKAKGGDGQNGANAAGNGGQGGTGGGGGGAAALWNFNAVAGTNYSVAFNTGSTNRVSFGSLLSVSAGVDGSAGGSGGGLFSVDPSVIFYDAKTGTPAGVGGAVKTTDGNGNAGSNSSGNGSLVAIPANVGLTSIRAGGGGGGGGGGARDATGSAFYNGGNGGTGGALDGNNGGGGGGGAFQDGDLNGSAGGSGVLGNGGGGGAGGAFQSGFGNGTGGTGSTGTGAVVYIYTR